jgi:cell division septation protein DedD
MEDHDEGMEAGARLGVPSPEWDETDVAGEPDGSEHGSRGAAGGGQRLVRGAFVALAVAGFFGVLWYAYQWGLGDSEVVELPVVATEPGPDKVKPTDPGGLQVPYQDQLVLNRDSATGGLVRVERLLPPPEVPLPPPLPAEAISGQDVPLAIETAAGPAEPETIPEVGETAISPAISPGVSAAPAPPEPAPPAESETTITPAKSPAKSPAVAAAPAPPKPAPPAESKTATAGGGQAAQPKAAASAPQVATAGNFALQLASLKSPDAAEKEWARLRGAYPNLLGSLSLILQPADVPGVGKVYRLKIGTFPNRTTAADVCVELKTKQQDCFVVRQ